MKRGTILETVLRVPALGEPFVGIDVEVLDEYVEDGIPMCYVQSLQGGANFKFHVPTVHVKFAPPEAEIEKAAKVLRKDIPSGGKPKGRAKPKGAASTKSVGRSGAGHKGSAKAKGAASSTKA